LGQRPSFLAPTRTARAWPAPTLVRAARPRPASIRRAAFGTRGYPKRCLIRAGRREARLRLPRWFRAPEKAPWGRVSPLALFPRRVQGRVRSENGRDCSRSIERKPLGSTGTPHTSPAGVTMWGIRVPGRAEWPSPNARNRTNTVAPPRRRGNGQELHTFRDWPVAILDELEKTAARSGGASGPRV